MRRYRYVGPSGHLRGIGYVSNGDLLPVDAPQVLIDRLLVYEQLDDEAEDAGRDVITRKGVGYVRSNRRSVS